MESESDPLTRRSVDLFEKEPLKGKWGVHLHTPTKFGKDPSQDLGGDREQTHKQTLLELHYDIYTKRFMSQCRALFFSLVIKQLIILCHKIIDSGNMSDGFLAQYSRFLTDGSILLSRNESPNPPDLYIILDNNSPQYNNNNNNNKCSVSSANSMIRRS